MTISKASHPAKAGPRTIYRGKAPERKPLFLLGLGLIGACLIGVWMRGPEPAIVVALVLTPVGVFAYALFERRSRMRIGLVDMDGPDLVLHTDFAKTHRMPLSGSDAWRLEDIALYTTGVSYDANQTVQIDTGAEMIGPALVAVDSTTGKRIELVLDGAEVDIAAFRTFAPAAIADLEKRAASKGRQKISFKPL